MKFDSAPKIIDYREMFKNKLDKDGYLSIGEFATQIIKRQAQYVARFLDGDAGTSQETNFGKIFEIKYKGDSGNYSDMKIHIDDLNKFISLVYKYYNNFQDFSEKYKDFIK